MSEDTSKVSPEQYLLLAIDILTSRCRVVENETMRQWVSTLKQGCEQLELSYRLSEINAIT